MDGSSGWVLSGTCGWSDPSIARAGFYPRKATTASDKLPIYARRWQAVEIDTSTYAIPTVRRVEEWASKTPAGFVFSIKAFGLFASKACPANALPADIRGLHAEALAPLGSTLAYDTLPGDVLDSVWARFNDTVDALVRAGKLGAVVFQFNRGFLPGPAAAAHT
ncbi:hypothetical protein FNF27_00639 [Cafeteria roenbergensis]|uniref:DUF72 domain-containing protein n=1 Tax=Cafeteria roenbergensis TaxID=33653 RepID=A0A5A8CWU3_CAFRO|nr:hypothetical protein FNF29_00052 [Cafeteria roenbergensis]KAA0166138.1 hypothetical protein FNF28_03188 [Cafeteria roenbergensis]KAA0178091.1 hypothetical protein FNF27_00639 [Cafeteria roenbergensis]|eukprot:KAA0157476.1 hypothetical protein FNF29_00052 [Cafeteria roenbergensis]